jgi:hypothetical protein
MLVIASRLDFRVDESKSGVTVNEASSARERPRGGWDRARANSPQRRIRSVGVLAGLRRVPRAGEAVSRRVVAPPTDGGPR